MFKDATRVGGRYFTILVRRSDQPGARLGLIVSKKVDRRAVGRNRVKRWIRESFRKQLVRLPAADCVVLAKPSAGKAESEPALAELERGWISVCKRLR